MRVYLVLLSIAAALLIGYGVWRSGVIAVPASTNILTGTADYSDEIAALSGQVTALSAEVKTLKDTIAQLSVSLSGIEIKARVTELPAPPQISALLLSRLLPTISLKRSEGLVPFDLPSFSGSRYDAYEAKDVGLKVFVFGNAFPLVYNQLAQMKEFSVKEEKMFFDRTVYLNSVGTNSLRVRFLVLVEGQAVGIDVPKTFYERLKSFLIR